MAPLGLPIGGLPVSMFAHLFGLNPSLILAPQYEYKNLFTKCPIQFDMKLLQWLVDPVKDSAD